MLTVLDRPGVWRFAAFTGALVGLDLAAAMASLPRGLDRERARALFIAAETAFVQAIRDAVTARTGLPTGEETDHG